jgi:hypothetical protein
MNLDYYSILKKANAEYGVKALQRQRRDPRYVAPEDVPQIQSEQVKCVLEALVEAINSHHTSTE